MGSPCVRSERGADELFWGYPGWKTALKLQQWDDLPFPAFLKKLGLGGLRLLGKGDTTYYELLRRGAAGQPVFWGGAEAFTETRKRHLLGSRLRKKFADLSSWEVVRPLRDRFEDKAWEKSHLNWMSYLDLNLRLPELLLMRVDKMSMAVSLEGRVPFLDHKFVELAMSIPESAKTRHGQLKSVLKKAVRGVIPDEIIGREKQGFGVPIHEWFLDRLGQEVWRELSQFCDRTDFLDRAAVRRLVEQKRAPQVWYLFNFALWWRQYVAA